MEVVVTTSVLVRCEECGVSWVTRRFATDCNRPLCHGRVYPIRAMIDIFLQDRLA